MPKRSGPHPLQRPVHWCIHDICACSVSNTKTKHANWIANLFQQKTIIYPPILKLFRYIKKNYRFNGYVSSSSTPIRLLAGFVPNHEAMGIWLRMVRHAPTRLDRWGVGSVSFHRVCFGWIFWSRKRGVFFSPVQTTTEAGIPTHWLWGNMLLLQIFQDSGSYASQERSFKSADNQQVTPVR